MASEQDKTQSIWMSFTPPTAPPLQGDLTCDVCVVGAGIAGLTTAYLLACEGRSVVVLDRHGIGQGETQRTTAHLSNALDDRYHVLERIHGEEAARLAAESHTTAIDMIQAIAEREAIACDFERLDGYLFLAPGDDPDVLTQEHETCRRIGMADVELAQGQRLGTLDGVSWLRFPRQGQFHPLKYLTGLVQHTHGRGGSVRIFGGTPVDTIQGGPAAFVGTQAGQRVHCAAIVVATNTPMNDLVAVHTKQAPYRTYALAARLPKGMDLAGLYWDTADPYHYVRRQSGPDGDFLIVGGEDHKTGQDEPAVDHFAALESWARERFPGLGAVAHRWSGQVMETVDGLAFIGRNPMDHDNVFIATGDSGMGMTHGTIAGILLTELIHGRDHRWRKLYDPARKPGKAAGDYLKENANVAWQYTDWVTGGDVSSLEQVPAGEGAVIRSGLRKIAAYRDESGHLTQMSAVCTHLGCLVRWNGVEKTWDCPCHGSRFDCYGKVIAGPAVRDLADVTPSARLEDQPQR